MSEDINLNAKSCLVNPDNAELKALARLSDNPDFATFYGYLEKCLKEQDKKNRVINDDVALRHGQGVSQALESAMSIMLNAKTALRRHATSV